MFGPPARPEPASAPSERGKCYRKTSRQLLKPLLRLGRSLANAYLAASRLSRLKGTTAMIVTDIAKIEKLSKRKANENWKFRAFLKSTPIPTEKIDAIVHRLNEQVSAQIDCTACANCCKTVSPTLDEEDVVTFAQGLGISSEQLKSQYLVEDEEGFTFNATPCPFLVDNKCSNYEHRPKACASYPHLHKEDFIFRTIGVINNCSVCPIVFNVVERLKGELRHGDELEDFDDFLLMCEAFEQNIQAHGIGTAHGIEI
jgi:hypothetical protein